MPVVEGRRKKMHRCALVAKQYRVRNMLKNKNEISTIADRTVSEKVTKGRARIRWDSVVEKV